MTLVLNSERIGLLTSSDDLFLTLMPNSCHVHAAQHYQSCKMQSPHPTSSSRPINTLKAAYDLYTDFFSRREALLFQISLENLRSQHRICRNMRLRGCLAGVGRTKMYVSAGEGVYIFFFSLVTERSVKHTVVFFTLPNHESDQDIVRIYF